MPGSKYEQQTTPPTFEADLSLIDTIKLLLNLLNFNMFLANSSSENRDSPEFRAMLWEATIQENAFPTLEFPGSEPEDLSIYLCPASRKVLETLQRQQLLPEDPKELKNALYLLVKCTLFVRDFINPLLLNTVLNAKQKGWNTLFDTYNRSTHKNGFEINEVLQNYMKAIFYPRLLRGAKKLTTPYNISRYLGQADVKAAGEKMSFTKFGSSILFKGKDIADLASFSDHWHAPLQLTAFQSIKLSDALWPSLFQSKEESVQQKPHKELEIPEYLIGKKNYKFICLTTHEELREEGKKLQHCVGGYARKCQMENTHILSLVDEQGQSLSTLELQVNLSNQQITCIQHRGARNSEPSEQLTKAQQWLMHSLKNGAIRIDFNHLKEQRQQRLSSIIDMTEHDLNFVPFNPYGSEGLKIIKKVKDIYRKHTPPSFRQNLHDLAHIEKVKLNIFPLVFKKIDLLTEDERVKKTLKEEKAKQWSPRHHWSSAKAEEKGYNSLIEQENDKEFIFTF